MATLYENTIDSTGFFVYPTEYTCQLREPRKKTLKRQDSTREVYVLVLGIPDGLSSYVNQALIPETVRRLYIYSTEPLLPEHLRYIESEFKNTYYPFPKLLCPTECPVQPTRNFYMLESDQLSSLVEYRYFSKRTESARILYNDNSHSCTAFAPPDYCMPLLAIIMPSNYVRVTNNSGYLVVNSYIIHIVSRHLLLGERTHPDGQRKLINDIDIVANPKILEAVQTIYARMGVINAYAVTKKQYIGFDDYMSFIFGDYSDINL